ncbi:UNVERIFIED_CONTAM: hypothetical protein HDU68_002216 [Siphonaria sp. JEL0065]|nr:hypothetical protein HDU68_002216 [Siphonaria sp. JEL0065]
MSTYVPNYTNNPRLATKSHFGVETSVLHPHRSINKGPLGPPSLKDINDQTPPAPPPVLPSMLVATVSPTELSEIQKLSEQATADIRETFMKEKKRLHQESMEKSKMWPKTIVGDRIRKLEEMDRREAQIEADKVKVDNEWHAIVAKERQDKLQRAFAMQKSLSSPEVRLLHSKLALSNVLFERDRQVEHQKKMKEIMKENSFDESMIVKKAQRELAMELVKKEMAKREAKRIAQEYPVVIKQKQDAIQAMKKANQVFQNNIIEAAKHELQEEMEAQKIWKQVGFSEVEEAFVKALEHKKAKRQEQRLEEKQMFHEHQLYHDSRDYIAKKRAEVSTNKRLIQERIYNKVAEMNLELAQESNARISKAVSMMENAHKNKMKIREETDHLKKIEREIDVARGRFEQISAIEKEKKLKEQEGFETRKVLDKDFEEFQKLNQRDQKLKVESLRKHKTGLLQQIAANKCLKEKEEAQAKQLDKTLMDNFNKESNEYLAFANTAIDEFRKEGKSVVPAIHIVNPRQPFPPAQFETRHNTFTTLGFI